jgi:hypothetical protein
MGSHNVLTSLKLSTKHTGRLSDFFTRAAHSA